MANSETRAQVTPPRGNGGNPAAPMRTTATQRVREAWNTRLTARERELLGELAGLERGRALYYAARRWEDIQPALQGEILRALRELVSMGQEAAYALGYARRYS